MARVVLSEDAHTDLHDIDRFSIERFGADVAADYMTGFAEAFARLSDYPLSAPLIAAIKPPIHCLNYRSHRILYDFDGKTVVIVRVVHGARDLGRILN